MTLAELLVLAVGLSMDAFAVAVCKGLAMKRTGVKECAGVGLWFGGFQALMPLIGFVLGTSFANYISRFDHWIAFILLALIGANMIREAFKGEECPVGDPEHALGVKTMFPLAVATSIDALAVGVTFAFLGPTVGVVPGALIIGLTTFAIAAAGVKIGNVFGAKYQKKKAAVAGGSILCLLGVKYLLEHLGVINF